MCRVFRRRVDRFQRSLCSVQSTSRRFIRFVSLFLPTANPHRRHANKPRFSTLAIGKVVVVCYKSI